MIVGVQGNVFENSATLRFIKCHLENARLYRLEKLFNLEGRGLRISPIVLFPVNTEDENKQRTKRLHLSNISSSEVPRWAASICSGNL